MSELRTPIDYLREWSFDPGFTEHIDMARLFTAHSPGGAVLDLGCGPMLPAWAAFHPRLSRLAGLDRNPENIDLLRQADLTDPTWLAAHAYARSLGRKTELAAAFAALAPGDLRVGDVTVLQADWVGAFDVVSQIGCFVCLPSDALIVQAMQHAAAYLKPGGIFFSVFWQGQPGYIEDPVWGGPERTARGAILSAAEMAALAKEAAFTLLESREGQSDTPDIYRAVVYQAYRRDEP